MAVHSISSGLIAVTGLSSARADAEIVPAFARTRDTTSLVATRAGRQSAVLTREAQRAYRPGMVETSATFTGSIPHYYDSCFGPAYLDPIVLDLAQRLPAKPP